MKKEFVTYELAVKLKALGFDEPCFGWYENNELVTLLDCTSPEDIIEFIKVGEISKRISAPTFSQAFRWFREKYGMIFTLIASTYYYPSVSFINTDGNSEIELGEFETYEESEIACLEKLIEIAGNR